MIYKMISVTLIVCAIVVMIITWAKMDRLAADIKLMHREITRQGDEFRNANGFDIDNVPCHVLEASDGVVRCRKNKNQ